CYPLLSTFDRLSQYVLLLVFLKYTRVASYTIRINPTASSISSVPIRILPTICWIDTKHLSRLIVFVKRKHFPDHLVLPLRTYPDIWQERSLPNSAQYHHHRLSTNGHMLLPSP